MKTNPNGSCAKCGAHHRPGICGIRTEGWGVWGGETRDEPAHWLAAHTGRTIVFPAKEIAEEVAQVTSLNGLHYEARRFEITKG